MIKEDFFSIQNKNKEAKTVDILLYGPIPHYDWTQDKQVNSATNFVTEIKRLENEFDRINIHINTPGGSMIHGLPIFNAIASSKADIHTYNDGVAASMGAVILMAAKKENIHSSKNSLIMIHPASSDGFGNAKQLAEQIKVLEKFDNSIINTIMDLSGKSKEEVEERFFDGNNHWLTTEDALTYGLIGQIEDYAAHNLPANGNVSKIQNMNFLEICNEFEQLNAPKKEESIFARIKETIYEAFKSIPTIENNFPHINKTDMTFENELKILGMENPSKEELASVKNALEKITGNSEVFTKEEFENQLKLDIKDKLDAEKKTHTAVITAKDEEITKLKNTITALENSDGADSAAASEKKDLNIENQEKYDRNNYSHNRSADALLENY